MKILRKEAKRCFFEEKGKEDNTGGRQEGNQVESQKYSWSHWLASDSIVLLVNDSNVFTSHQFCQIIPIGDWLERGHLPSCTLLYEVV